MRHTAGIVLWRPTVGPGETIETVDATASIEILLAHPGGPFWAAKDQHAWSIPKGEFDPDSEAPWDAAQREWEEELGSRPPTEQAVAVPPFRAGNKLLHAWAVAGDFDSTTIGPEDQHRSIVEMVWPPRAKTLVTFPEVDRVEWVRLDRSSDKLHKGQAPLVDALRRLLDDGEIRPNRQI